MNEKKAKRLRKLVRAWATAPEEGVRSAVLEAITELGVTERDLRAAVQAVGGTKEQS